MRPCIREKEADLNTGSSKILLIQSSSRASSTILHVLVLSYISIAQVYLFWPAKCIITNNLLQFTFNWHYTYRVNLLISHVELQIMITAFLQCGLYNFIIVSIDSSFITSILTDNIDYNYLEFKFSGYLWPIGYQNSQHNW